MLRTWDHITEFSADLGVYFNLPLSKRLAVGSKLLIGRSIIQDLDLNGHFSGKIPEWNSTATDFVYTTPYDVQWDYITVSGNNTTKYGTGLSLTYAYKSNFSWRLFADYDFTRKHYTMEYDDSSYLNTAFPIFADLLRVLEPESLEKKTSTIKKNMNSFVLGAAFTISF